MQRPVITLHNRGSILLVFLITLPFVIAVCLAYTELSLASFQVARLDQFRTAAQLAADAGADYAIQKVSEDNDWAGTASDALPGDEITLHSDSQVRTTFEISVVGDDIAKTASVIGRTYTPLNAAEPRRTVKIHVDLRPVSSGLYSVITGAGGLFMSNSSKIVGGSVFINGEINMSNSAQIGLSTNPVSVKVAHQICPKPANATYPRVCAAGENGQPIALNSPNALIYGEVRATNQTNGTGMSGPGLIANSVVDPEPLPEYNRQNHINAVVPANAMTGAAASCSGNGSTRTWKANTKITGNVTVSNKCKVTVQGDIWITGTLSLSNDGTELIVGSAGRPNIMVDGAGGISLTNSASLQPNATGVGFALYTFHNTKTGCTPTPADCTTVTGTDLANSRSVTTISISNGGDATNSIFYAYWTQVQLSNSGQIGAVLGQTIRLTNSAKITFGTGIATGGNVTWVDNGYRRQ